MDDAPPRGRRREPTRSSRPSGCARSSCRSRGGSSTSAAPPASSAFPRRSSAGTSRAGAAARPALGRGRRGRRPVHRRRRRRARLDARHAAHACQAIRRRAASGARHGRSASTGPTPVACASDDLVPSRARDRARAPAHADDAFLSDARRRTRAVTHDRASCVAFDELTPHVRAICEPCTRTRRTSGRTAFRCRRSSSARASTSKHAVAGMLAENYHSAHRRSHQGRRLHATAPAG